MGSFRKKVIRSLHGRLNTIIESWEPKPVAVETTQPFHSLSPISDADVSQYIAALNWALENRNAEHIHNIALTGPYGSGKSSILNTFKAQNKNKEFVFLEISLATFKEEMNPPKADAKPEAGAQETQLPTPRRLRNQKKNEDLLRLIEFSILQQIFYHEDDSQIPDSRFRKIKSVRQKDRLNITAGIMIALLCTCYLFFPVQCEKMLRFKFPDTIALIFHYVAMLTFLAAVTFIIFRSVRLLFGIRISKFKIKEAEIEIDKGISKSILNNHLDEILYFFEATDYSVVMIEDLDRFRQAEIFTKLRELNLLINSSKKVEQTVVFIYAVRDELFQDKDRTKFFDFIVPVIPVINSSNSNDKLAKLIADNKFPVSTTLIDDVSLFIDDMRLLYNIVNEYHVYRELLDKQLPQDQLFAMIVYKNIHPDDFVKLSDGEGKLYELLRSRIKFIQQTIAEINRKIEGLRNEIQVIEDIQIKDSDELRMLYLSYYINSVKGFSSFAINGDEKTLKDVGSDDTLFDYIIADQVECNYFARYQTESYKKSIKFAPIENEIDPDQTYAERLQAIVDFWDEKTETLKAEIQQLEVKKQSIRHLKLQQILSEPDANVVIDASTKQGSLLRLMLRYGYIDENYLDYISLFYVGSLTKDDRTFLLNVKSEIASDYDFNLTQIGNLIAKIRDIDFQHRYILNYALVDFLLVIPIYNDYLSAVMDQLNDQQPFGPEFVDGFINGGTNLEAFIKKLAAHWTGVWEYVAEKSDYTAEKKELYFKLLIANAAPGDLKNIAELSDLKQLIERRPDFLSIIPDETQLKSLIKTLDVKFKELEFKGVPKVMADFVYRGSYYEISSGVLARIIRQFGKTDQPTFDNQNYKAILGSECPPLIAYVEKEINTYVTAVYLELPYNHKEPEDTLTRLLNNKKIDIEYRIAIIKQVTTKISRLDKITDSAMEGPLYENLKVEPVWQNLIEYHHHVGPEISVELLAFLNDDANATALGEQVIDNEDTTWDIEQLESLLLAIVCANRIDDEPYATLLAAIPEDYDLAELTGLEEDKMKALIEYQMIKPSLENFFKLNEFYADLDLLYLEHNQAMFLAAITDFQLNTNDLEYLLKSMLFSAENKLTIIQSVEEALIIKSAKLLNQIAGLMFAHHPFAVSKSILIATLQQSLPVSDRVKLFNMHYRQFVMADINSIFKTFPYPYRDIGVRFTSPVIPENQENHFLANNLKQKEFITNVKPDKKGIKIVNFKKEV